MFTNLNEMNSSAINKIHFQISLLDIHLKQDGSWMEPHHSGISSGAVCRDHRDPAPRAKVDQRLVIGQVPGGPRVAQKRLLFKIF